MSLPIPGLTPGNDSIEVGAGHWHGRLIGNDTVNFTQNAAFTLTGGAGNDEVLALHGGRGRLSFGPGHDTIFASHFAGTIHGGGGGDLISLSSSSGLITGGRGNDTILVAGHMTVRSGGGHDDLVFFSNTHNHILATGGPGTDTFQYNFSDGAGDVGGPPDGSAIFHLGRIVITDFHKRDTLVFHDVPGDRFDQAEVNANATVTDHGKHHAVTIVIHTTHGHGAGTLVLRGIGTKGHHLNSIDALASHYHLSFT
jgi:Ca2+-binding RTX toxin-like protein